MVVPQMEYMVELFRRHFRTVESVEYLPTYLLGDRGVAVRAGFWGTSGDGGFFGFARRNSGGEEPRWAMEPIAGFDPAPAENGLVFWRDSSSA